MVTPHNESNQIMSQEEMDELSQSGQSTSDHKPSLGSIILGVFIVGLMITIFALLYSLDNQPDIVSTPYNGGGLQGVLDFMMILVVLVIACAALLLTLIIWAVVKVIRRKKTKEVSAGKSRT